ncbi:MAG: hypothetical protein ACFCUG_09860 [Thiotrichales bacterium]
MRRPTRTRLTALIVLFGVTLGSATAQPENATPAAPSGDPPLATTTAPPVITIPPRPRLPLELARFDDELQQLNTALTYELSESRTVLICATSRTLIEDATAIQKTPLLELTQGNFKSWQAATAELVARTQALTELCRQNDVLLYPVEEHYREIKTGFESLLSIRQ